jgi:hypothetical protein
VDGAVAEALTGRPIGIFPQVVLWALRDARVVERFYAHLRAWAEALDRLARDAPEDLAIVLRYVLTVAGDEPFEKLHQRIIEAAPSTENVMASPAEQLIQRGKAERKAEGKAEDVLAVLEAGGLSVAAEQRERITACRDLAEPDRWLRVAATTQSTAELFAD